MAKSIEDRKSVRDSSIRGRRKFLSSAFLGGAATTFLPSTSSADLEVVQDFLPTVADSLLQYREHVLQLPSLFTIVLPNSANILRDFVELYNIYWKICYSNTPKYVQDKYSEQLFNILLKGKVSAGRIGDQHITDEEVIVAHINAIQLAASYLNDLVSNTCQESKFVKAFANASRSVINDLLDQSNTAYSWWVAAIVAGNSRESMKRRADAVIERLDLAGQQFKRGEKTEAVISVIEAKQILAFFDSNKITQGQARALRTIQSLLDGCIAWIKRGGKLPDPTKNERHHSFLVKGSPAATLGLWGTVRQVLKDLLPENSTTRILACVVLISPILIGYSNHTTRSGLIYEVLPNLFPEGKNDSSETSRKAAAERLSKAEV